MIWIKIYSGIGALIVTLTIFHPSFWPKFGRHSFFVLVLVLSLTIFIWPAIFYCAAREAWSRAKELKNEQR